MNLFQMVDTPFGRMTLDAAAKLMKEMQSKHPELTKQATTRKKIDLFNHRHLERTGLLHDDDQLFVEVK